MEIQRPEQLGAQCRASQTAVTVTDSRRPEQQLCAEQHRAEATQEPEDQAEEPLEAPSFML